MGVSDTIDQTIEPRPIVIVDPDFVGINANNESNYRMAQILESECRRCQELVYEISRINERIGGGITPEETFFFYVEIKGTNGEENTHLDLVNIRKNTDIGSWFDNKVFDFTEQEIADD